MSRHRKAYDDDDLYDYDDYDDEYYNDDYETQGTDYQSYSLNEDSEVSQPPIVQDIEKDLQFIISSLGSSHLSELSVRKMFEAFDFDAEKTITYFMNKL